MIEKSKTLWSVDLHPANSEPIHLTGCLSVDEINLPGGLRIVDSEGCLIITTLPYVVIAYNVAQ